MPIYVYQCKNCGHILEKQQSFSDRPLTLCPNCHQNQLRKKIGNVGVVFRGSGFYSTDKSSSTSSNS